MRHFDIARVSNGTTIGYPQKALQDMTFEEIKNKYLKMCGKSNGNASVCSKCQHPCPEGKRAIQLLANEVYNDPPIPLYGGKTLIERAKEENMLRRKKLEEEKKMSELKVSKNNKIFIDDWYEKAVASGDPVKWVMEIYNISKKKAQHKIYNWRYNHRDQNSDKEIKQEVKMETTITESISDSIESKMDSLMKIQEKQKKIMLEFQEQYEKAKKLYEATSKKIDILCNAMDIINE